VIISKKVVIAAIFFSSVLLLITLLSVANMSSKYGLYRDLKFSFAVLRDPSIQPSGQTYLGTPFIDFILPDLSGTLQRLSDIKATIKIIVLFNTSDCAGCLEEYRFWKRVDAFFPDDLVKVIAIANDKEMNEIRSFIEERELRFQVLSDPDNFIRRSMGFRYSPLRITVDRTNIINDIAVTGMNLSQQDAFLSYLRSLLEKQKE